ncbi:hypothetical protein F4778DRAFT_789878 [Xylariomycetidae sp. FL2044]|nr:hypothetical protein F4778DRAFT_789878 [Xylariomycetidae sp. FL2044]
MTRSAIESESSWLRVVGEKAKGSVTYHVERISDGRSYITRLVRAMAGDACVYIAIVSFQNNKEPVLNALTYAVAMPELDPSLEEVPQGLISVFSEPWTNETKGTMEPFDFRLASYEFSSQQTEVRIVSFVQTTQPLSWNTAVANLVGLAYVSDHLVAGVPISANPTAAGRGGSNLALITSLTHDVSFHDPTAQIREWIISERRTSWGADGGTLVHQRLWDWKSGGLLLSMDLEALVRLKNQPKL